MSMPSTGEIWFRYDSSHKENKYVVVTAVKGKTVFATYISNVADKNTSYPSFARLADEFSVIFKRKDESWV